MLDWRLCLPGERDCLNLASKALKHKKFQSWFKQLNCDNPAGKALYAETLPRQKRLSKSPIPYLTRLLNKNNGYQ